MGGKKKIERLQLQQQARESGHNLPSFVRSENGKICIKDISEIDFSNERQLGQGNFGKVIKAYHVPSDTEVAIKQVRIQDDQESMRTLTREISHLHKCKSPHVIYSYGAYNFDGHINIVMEYMDKGTIKDALQKSECLQEPVIGHIAFQVLSGLEYLHSNRIVHRDIKPSNLLLSSDGLIKISDFGTSNEVPTLNATINSYVGTVTYMSPERIRGEKYKLDTDIWSLGLTLLECALGHYPLFDSKEQNDPLNVFQLIAFSSEDLASKVPHNASDEFKDFVSICLGKTSGSRSSVRHLLNHPFIIANNSPIPFLLWLNEI